MKKKEILNVLNVITLVTKLKSLFSKKKNKKSKQPENNINTNFPNPPMLDGTGYHNKHIKNFNMGKKVKWKKSLREVFRVFVATGIAGIINYIEGNPENFSSVIMLVPAIRGTSKFLHNQFPNSFLISHLPF